LCLFVKCLVRIAVVSLLGIPLAFLNSSLLGSSIATAKLRQASRCPAVPCPSCVQPPLHFPLSCPHVMPCPFEAHLILKLYAFLTEFRKWLTCGLKGLQTEIIIGKYIIHNILIYIFIEYIILICTEGKQIAFTNVQLNENELVIYVPCTANYRHQLVLCRASLQFVCHLSATTSSLASTSSSSSVSANAFTSVSVFVFVFAFAFVFVPLPHTAPSCILVLHYNL